MLTGELNALDGKLVTVILNAEVSTVVFHIQGKLVSMARDQWKVVVEDITGDPLRFAEVQFGAWDVRCVVRNRICLREEIA